MTFILNSVKYFLRTGGKGNHYFLSNENRAPTTHELGGKGQERELILELRIMADVGLVRTLLNAKK